MGNGRSPVATYPGPRIGCNDEAVLVEPCRSSLALLLSVPRSLGSDKKCQVVVQATKLDLNEEATNRQWFGTQLGCQPKCFILWDVLKPDVK
jgi:hypothetical protein